MSRSIELTAPEIECIVTLLQSYPHPFGLDVNKLSSAFTMRFGRSLSLDEHEIAAALPEDVFHVSNGKILLVDRSSTGAQRMGKWAWAAGERCFVVSEDDDYAQMKEQEEAIRNTHVEKAEQEMKPKLKLKTPVAYVENGLGAGPEDVSETNNHPTTEPPEEKISLEEWLLMTED